MKDRALWLKEAKWGVFCHYLAMPPSTRVAGNVDSAEWNRRVDSMKLDVLAEQLIGMGCGYFFITLGQCTGQYLAPNPVYDELTGVVPSKCARRDVIAELYEYLQPAGIRMGLYIPAQGPGYDRPAAMALEYYPKAVREQMGDAFDPRMPGFQRKWEAVLRCWSERYGEKISAWWIDACYAAKDMYLFDDEPNYKSFAAALRAGNPEAIVAFNQDGLGHLGACTPHQDFTAGEMGKQFTIPEKEFFDGARLHILSYTGDYWCTGDKPALCDDFVVGYTRQVNDMGGAVTWDVPIRVDGTIPEPFVRQLRELGRRLGTIREK